MININESLLIYDSYGGGFSHALHRSDWPRQRFPKNLINIFCLRWILRSREAREIPFVIKSEYIFTEPEIPKEIPQRIRYMDSFTLSDDEGESEVI